MGLLGRGEMMTKLLRREGGWADGQVLVGVASVVGVAWTDCVTHLLQLHAHLVEGSQPVGFGPGHGILPFLALLILSRSETKPGKAGRGSE